MRVEVGVPGLSVLTSLLVSVDVKDLLNRASALVTNLSLICQLTSEDTKQNFIHHHEELSELWSCVNVEVDVP